MGAIVRVVRQALKIGCLTFEAEQHLRHLLKRSYDSEDLRAFMTLQRQVMAGTVKQQSRELRHFE